MDEEQIKLLIGEAISYWRTLFDQLSLEQQKIRAMPFYFAAPLQIEFFRFFNKPLDVSVQLWVFSQFEDRGDKEIIGHNIKTTSAEGQITQILEDQRFDRYLEDSSRFSLVEETLTVRQAVAEACESTLRKLRGDLLGAIWAGPGYGMSAGGGYPSEKLWFWMFSGDPKLEDIKVEISNSIELAKGTRTAAITREAEPEIKRKDRAYDLLGSYLFPPVWIGERPKPSVQQLLSSGMYGYNYQSSPLMQIVCEYEIDEVRLISTQDGLIAMSTPDKRLFLDTFNILVAILDLNGYEFLTLRDSELMYIDYIRDKRDEIHPSSYESNKARLSPWFYRSFLTPVIPIELLRQIFQLCESVIRSEPLKRLFTIFGEAYSHLLQEEYAQSVLWGWIFVEQWVSLKWEEYLITQGVSSKISNALSEVDISRNLRVLSKLRILDANTKNQLERFRNLRNNIAHRGRLVTKDEANQALASCKELLFSFV